MDAISGFYTSEGFFNPGLVLAGVAVFDEFDEIYDLFNGSYTDYLAAPTRLVVPGVGLEAAVVGRLIPLVAVVEVLFMGFLGVVVGVGSSLLAKRDVTGLFGVAVVDIVDEDTADGLEIPKVFLGAGVLGASA